MPYGELMDVLERLRLGGYPKIALVALEGIPDGLLGLLPRRHSHGAGPANNSNSVDREMARQMTQTLWVFSALCAVAIHVACVALAFGSMQRDDDQSLGAPAIEIGVELASPRLEPTGLPVGPDTDASAEAPEVIQQKTVVEKNDLPKATPTETDNPDRIVSPDDTKPDKDPS